MAISIHEDFNQLKEKVRSVKFRDYTARDDVLRRAGLYSRRVFGAVNYFIDQIDAVRFESGIYIGGKGPSRYDYRRWEEGKQDLINIIDLMLEELGPAPEPTSESVESTLPLPEPRILNEVKRMLSESPETKLVNPDGVFIVHGHDSEMKESVARTIEQLKLNPIILHEQPNRGRTIIEKFEQESADIGFAVVLLSPDDEGKKEGEGSLLPRARQNVILELGFFFAKLGRGRVAALYKDVEGFDLPSDITGVIYIPYDKSGAWKFDLCRELLQVGYEVNANDLL